MLTKISAFLTALAFAFSAAGGEPAEKGNDKAPMGSPDFYPSSEHPVGWRGDGTGCYPNASPPIMWSRSESGEKQNILWETKLPSYSWATPLIVGDKIFVRSEPFDLICLNKTEGKILWIRSHSPYTALNDEDKKANPALNDVAPLVAKLNEANDAYVAAGSTPAIIKQKHDLEKQLNDALAKIDKKYRLPPDQWNESWTGLTGATPVSDGTFIYFNSGSGVTACYDLNGNRKWARYERIPDVLWSEHGHAFSPSLVGDKLLVPTIAKGFQHELLALNKVTGAEYWRQTYPNAGLAYETLPFRTGGIDYVFAWCNLIRVSDGKSVFSGKPEAAVGAGGVIRNNTVFYTYAAPGLVAYKFEPKTNGELQVGPPVFDAGNGFLPLPVETAESGSGGFDIMQAYIPAPLYHDGLVYLLSNGGRLTVVDAQKPVNAAVVYTKIIPFDRRNPKHRHTYGCGICASPAIAGKYIYLMDNAGCTIVIEPGREYKQIAKNNIEFKLPHGWEESHYDGPRQEVTLSTPIFDGGRVFIRGEQNLYCIGDPKAPKDQSKTDRKSSESKPAVKPVPAETHDTNR
jgi:outer membrane protein assembly factor BamB